MNDGDFGNVDRWFVAFWPQKEWWQLYGRFSHVTCLGFSRQTDTWIAYDVNSIGTHFRVAYAFDDVENMLNHYWTHAVVVEALPPAREGSKPLRLVARSPFSCVSAAKHLLGINSRALSPEGLYNTMIAQGCTVVNDETSRDPRPDRAPGAHPHIRPDAPMLG